MLRGDAYERATKSQFLPKLDIELLSRHTWRRDQHQAVRDFDAALKAARRKPPARTKRTRRAH